jgi:hypothetical protein
MAESGLRMTLGGLKIAIVRVAPLGAQHLKALLIINPDPKIGTRLAADWQPILKTPQLAREGAPGNRTVYVLRKYVTLLMVGRNPGL